MPSDEPRPLPRLLFAILFAATIQCLAGCAAWQTRNWDLSQLRDPRAAELDHRLQQQPEATAVAFAEPTAPLPGDREELSEPKKQGADTP